MCHGLRGSAVLTTVLAQLSMGKGENNFMTSDSAIAAEC